MANVLQEFLVSLGVDFKHEKFKAQVESSTEAIKKFAEHSNKLFLEITGISVASLFAIGASIAEATHRYERLYFASQRVGMTVPAIRALEFASHQVGVSVEAADAAMENFGATMRTQPWLAGIFGVDPSKGVLGLVDQLRKSNLPHFMQQRIAGMFGIDEKTFHMYKENFNTLIEQQEVYRRVQRDLGLDAKEVVHSFHEFGLGVYELQQRFVGVSEAIAFKFLPAAKSVVHWLNELLTSREEGGPPQYRTTEPGGMTPLGEVAVGGGILGVLSLLQMKFVRKFAAKGLGGTLVAALGFLKSHPPNDPIWAPIRKELGMGDWTDEDIKQWQNAFPRTSGTFKPPAAIPWSPPSEFYWAPGGPGITPPPAPTGGGGGVGGVGGVGGRQFSQENNTNIYIQPGPTAHDTAQSVGDEFNRVYADLARYGKQVLIG